MCIYLPIFVPHLSFWCLWKAVLRDYGIFLVSSLMLFQQNTNSLLQFFFVRAWVVTYAAFVLSLFMFSLFHALGRLCFIIGTLSTYLFFILSTS